MKNKGWIVVIIILIPSLIWVLLDVSLIHSKKLNYFGPKKLAANNKDTIYYSIGEIRFLNENLQEMVLDTNQYPIFISVFISPDYVKEKFRIDQFVTMCRYEPDKIKHIPVFLIYPFTDSKHIFHIKDSLHITLKNVSSVFLPDSIFNSVKQKFFLMKPYYVDYSFAVLIDKNRHIRGYYDWRYADELKRTIQEFNHLLIKEGYKSTLRKNKIEQK
ncbi:MAG: hypothetical protein N2203_00260 [Bacteroidia bacterium]|nr:hypothetical protein [Bacteroidia bacterium]